jgi:hypothetical protein
MTETLRVNLDKTATSLKILSTVAGALIACAVVYGQIDDRMDKLELEQATFKGVIDERTRNMGDDMTEIKSDMKLLLNKLQLGKNNGEETK